MKIARKPEWHQDTPRMQVVALLSAAQGHAMNAEDGIDPVAQAKKSLVFMEQAQEILHQMPEAGEWDKPWQKLPMKTVHHCRTSPIRDPKIKRVDDGTWVFAIGTDGGGPIGTDGGGLGTLDTRIKFCPFCGKKL